MEITKISIGLSRNKGLRVCLTLYNCGFLWTNEIRPVRMSERGHKPASQYTNITDRMDNSFYSGAVNIGHLNLGLLVGNAMQIVGLH